MIRKSPRSFVRDRSPTTPTDWSLVTRTIPLNGVLNEGNSSSMNRATCPEGGTSTAALIPIVVPSSSVSSKVTFVKLPAMLVIATPVRTEPTSPGVPAVSAYTRNPVPEVPAGTLASATVTPPLDSENTLNPAGAVLPEFGVTRIDPVWTADGFELRNLTEVRGSME